MHKFLVVGVQRSGTTFIGSSLDSHPAIKYVGEIFKIRGWYLNRATRQLTRRTAFSGDNGYSSWMDASIGRKLGHYCWRKRNTQQFLDHFYSLYDYDAVGFKLMSSQARRFGGIIPYVINNKVKVIHVVRENILKTHLSRLTAASRSMYHSDRTVTSSKIVVPVSELLSSLEKINADNQYWQTNFEQSTDYLQVSYESFVNNRAQISHDMLSFLGVEYHEIKSKLVKINPDSLQDIIKNYDEVVSLLDGSDFEWTLGLNPLKKVDDGLT